jgi:hypothetical protein
MVQRIKKYLDGKTIWSKILITILAKKEIKTLKLSSPPNHSITQRIQGLSDPPLSSTNKISMASSSTKDLIEGSYLAWFLMLGGEIMEAMT